jgi:mono/diheme cytochrome c family protein
MTLSARIVIGLGILILVPAGGQAAAGEPDRLFRGQVAPILEKRCLHCHGAETTKGGLSLASRKGLLRGGENGAAVVPGKPDESLLLEMVSGDAPEMPQKDKPLSKEQVEGLRSWVEQGAHWPEGVVLASRRFDGETWWAFRPLARPPLPAVRDRAWARTPVDAFVLARLEAEGLRPRPEADRRTLIRRLTFDLHGLPPTPDEIDRFLHDESPDAYEKLVDRLLASPRYGERWGRHWLDVVHYGDSHGYDKDKRRDHAWPYRDYVIRSLNEDVPYSRFIREQVAGDVLEPGDPRGVIATGFVAAGPWDFVGHVELGEQTVEKKKTRLIDRDDMLANTMSTFVSLTVHCARCHDHKFDPIPQRDYYRLQAVFAGVDRGDRPYDTRETERRRRSLEEQRRAAARRLEAIEKRVVATSSVDVARLDAAIDAARRQLADMPDLRGLPPSPSNGYHSSIHPRPEATAWVQVDLGRSVPIEEVRLVPARPVDFPDTPGFGFPHRFRLEVSDEPGFAPARTTLMLADDRPDGESVEDEPYIVRSDGRAARYVRVTATRLWKRTDDYVFALAELEIISGGENVARGARVTSLDSIQGGLWGRARLVDGFDSRHARPGASVVVVAPRNELLARIQGLRRARRRLAEDRLDPTLRAEREAARAEIAELDERIKSLPPGEMVYSLTSHAPRPIAVLRRGEVEQPGESVGPGALSCVPGLDPDFSSSAAVDEGFRRAALAEWIASPANVLTWRSMANRLWHYHFGRGLVDTPNDFGRNGSKPTHPELLDCLAIELRDRGQSLKALHRLIVTSAVYRQSSREDAASARRDADNRWLWRMNRQRLDAEELRDSVLAVSGELDTAMGGPGFELFRFKDDHSPIYDHTAPGVLEKPGTLRRTIYRFVVRSVPNPFLECLDGADPNINTPVRSTTITALQALALLNDAFMVRQSHAFARRLETLTGDLARRIDTAFVLALGRPPREAERNALSAYAQRHGLANACRLLLNTNEFLFVD